MILTVYHMIKIHGISCDKNSRTFVNPFYNKEINLEQDKRFNETELLVGEVTLKEMRTSYFCVNPKNHRLMFVSRK